MPDTDWKSRAEKAEAALREIKRRCAEYEKINLVGTTREARKAGTIRNCLLIARAALPEPNQPQDEGQER